MKFEWLVAQRYLRSPYRPAVLRLVTLLSVAGVAAGVGTLVIALAMNTGFRQTLQGAHRRAYPSALKTGNNRLRRSHLPS